MPVSVCTTIPSSTTPTPTPAPGSEYEYRPLFRAFYPDLHAATGAGRSQVRVLRVTHPRAAVHRAHANIRIDVVFIRHGDRGAASSSAGERVGAQAPPELEKDVIPQRLQFNIYE